VLVVSRHLDQPDRLGSYRDVLNRKLAGDMLRADDAYVEVAADSVGSRTLWYALTDHELIASSSQRAIITLLGSDQPNRDMPTVPGSAVGA
jgi:hypothetical protein